MKSILDPSFRYIPSAKTDLKKTFARIRLEQRAAKQQQVDSCAEPRRRAAIPIDRARKRLGI
jgi:hypothetical protein